MKKIVTLIMAFVVAAMTTGCTQELAGTLDHEAQEDAEDLLQEIRQAQETVQQAIMMMIKEKKKLQ